MTALVDLVDEHTEALEFDLIQVGLRLRDWPSKRLSWRDLWVFVRGCSQRRDSALYRAVNPDDAERTAEIDLLREIEYVSRVNAWVVGQGKRHDFPERIPLPWDPKPEPLWKNDVLDWDDAMALWFPNTDN